jgi:hypothetical protein
MRAAAEYLLNAGVDGSFLVRESESSPGEHTLSLRFDCQVRGRGVFFVPVAACLPGLIFRLRGLGPLSQVFHYRINKSSEGFYITRSNIKSSLYELVQHHSSGSFGSRPSLSSDCAYSMGPPPPPPHPPTTTTTPPLSLLLFSRQIGPQTCLGLVCPLRYPVAQQTADVVGVAPSSQTGDDRDPWELERARILLGPRLGAGQYGEVYSATWSTHGRRVAVKTIIEGRMNIEDFIREADVMKMVTTPAHC